MLSRRQMYCPPRLQNLQRDDVPTCLIMDYDPGLGPVYAISPHSSQYTRSCWRGGCRTQPHPPIHTHPNPSLHSSAPIHTPIPRNPPGDRWFRDSIFFLVTLLRNTTCTRPPLNPPLSPPPPSPPVRGTDPATNRMRVSFNPRVLASVSWTQHICLKHFEPGPDKDPAGNITSQTSQTSTYYIRRNAANVH